jgi:hypothetical protein
MVYSLLFLGYKPVQHVTVLNTVGNCNTMVLYYNMGRDSSVGIATRKGLDGPGIESRWGQDIPNPSRQAPGSPSLLYRGYRVYPGDKETGAWR